MDPPLGPRDRLVGIVRQYPGLHVRELARRAHMSEALAAYHLNQEAREGRLAVVEDGIYRRFYLPGSVGGSPDDREWMAHLRRAPALQIALYILEHGPSTHGELTTEVGLSKSTITYHLQNLLKARFVERVGPDDRFKLADPARVARILSRWAPTPDLTDRFSDLWGRFYRSQPKKK